MTGYELSTLADSLRNIAGLLEEGADSIENSYPRGTILKALPNQERFKPKSMWVSLGDGTYKHITGQKGLVTTHDRLDGYTSVIFSA